ncbi:MAG: hypothetical protein OEV61_01115 [Chloroflexota bacterium]|jgi:hypothetical protein|nr:hypothetical protein [Chloroflexota bacterium]MDH5242967.1 hypothetical protein [Chloroflexota bacterium]
MADIEETVSMNGSLANDIDGEQSVDAVTDGSSSPDAAPAVEASFDDRNEEGQSHASVVPSFLSELALAIRSAAARERERIATVIADDAARHREKARELAAGEAMAFQQLAEEDVTEIEAWADREVERIREDAARRIADRRSDLDVALQQQETILEAEIVEIDSAVGAYSTSLDTFFEDLDEATDLSDIAGRAGSVPTPPNLEDVRTLARASAMARIAEEAAARDDGPDTEASADEQRDGDGTSEPTADGDTAGVGDWTADGEAAPSLASQASVEPAASASAVDTEGSGIDTQAGDADASTAKSEDPQGRTGWEREDDAPDAIARPAPGAGWEPETPDLPGTSETATSGGAGSARTGWEREDSTANEAAHPVGVMDPSARSQTERSPEDLVGVQPYGHPNAAVRLIRSVAPWTAPTRSEEVSHPRRD